jgi:hypothetical protein
VLQKLDIIQVINFEVLGDKDGEKNIRRQDNNTLF